MTSILSPKVTVDQISVPDSSTAAASVMKSLPMRCSTARKPFTSMQGWETVRFSTVKNRTLHANLSLSLAPLHANRWDVLWKIWGVDCHMTTWKKNRFCEVTEGQLDCRWCFGLRPSRFESNCHCEVFFKLDHFTLVFHDVWCAH